MADDLPPDAPPEPATEVFDEDEERFAPNALEARNMEIVGMKVRGVAVAQIARTYHITPRRVRQIMKEWRATNPRLRFADPLDIVDEMLEQYAGAAEELALISATTSPQNAAVRVGSIKARMDVLRQQTELLQEVGVLPKNLGKLQVEMDVRFVAETIVKVMEEEGVDPRIQRRLIEAIERGKQRAQAAAAAQN